MPNRTLTTALRIYRWLLVAYPADFRRQYGPQMAKMFRDRCTAEQHQNGAYGLIGLWLHTLGDWAATVPAEHLDILSQDFRHGIRMLAKSPGLTAVAVLSLALGIGATTAMFSVVNAVLLRPLPFKDPHRVTELTQIVSSRNIRWYAVSPANFLDWKALSRSFEDMAAIRTFTVTLTGEGEPEKVSAQRVSSGFFRVLGVNPAMGRAFLAEEDQAPRGAPVTIISDALWRSRFGADRGLIGKPLRLDDGQYTIVGIMPPGFRFTAHFSDTRDVDLWLPYAFEADPPTARDTARLRAIARLRPGVPLTQAQAEMDGISRRLEQAYPKENERTRVSVVSVQEYLVHDDKSSLLALLAAVGAVLLIASVNVANLLLARAVGRQREMAIRTAIGARPRRLVRQLLTESVLLSVLGAGAGLLLAICGTRCLLSLSPGNIPRLDETGIDGTVLSFTLLITLATAMLFGLAPALLSSRPNLNESLKEAGRVAAGSLSRQRAQAVLLVMQVGLSMVLLIASSLTLNSFLRLQRVRLGFKPERLLTMQISLPRSRCAEEAGRGEGGYRLWKLRPERELIFQRIVQRLQTLPGVESVAATNPYDIPVSGGGWPAAFSIEGRPPFGNNDYPEVYLKNVSPEYFRTLGVDLLQGRQFTEWDGAGAPAVAIINEAMARRFWPGKESPLGKRLRVRESMSDAEAPMEIVGVVANVRQDLRAEPIPEICVPVAQTARTYIDWQIGFRTGMTFLVRTAGDPGSFIAAARSAVHEVVPDRPVEKVATMEELVGKSFGLLRSAMWLLGLFATIALMLSAVGVYGVVSYSASQRRHEIGVRMAMGAQRSDVLVLVMKQGMALTLAGLVLGVAGALAATRILASLLYGVKPTDPLTFASVVILFVAVALAASYIPAHRAIQSDPILALRHE